MVLSVAALTDGIFVEVFDNGIGMDREKLSELFREESQSIGLKNIQDRLTRMGGEGLKIESVPGEYTKVSFVLRSVDQ